MDSTDDHDLVGLDTPSPDPPFRLGVRVIRLQVLVGQNGFQSRVFLSR